ncbi:ABC transporter ATP-binding protein [Bacillus horti]|uniref:ABC-2 type transport system ATP-binding protein n=1 Tax=Caldalkalibacillus horti TaxID=77523 RepID=A0ABT9VVK4_9BACI|nr:ABC transporter ATP-binding protein [Bacillus horti]MDQ0165010.1 ABC-2 type transport system ATP-binding protein [Bacillus horti]
MTEILKVQNVSKVFKGSTAVNDVSFSIKKGSITAILGPNGAGKTTTISMMLGLLECTKGTIRLFDKPPKDTAVKKKIGVMLQEVQILDGLNVGEVIDLFRSYYPAPMSKEELLAIAGLEKEMKKRVEKLSGGQKRRLGFAIALAGDPELLFLDEPTVGMDTTSRTLFWNQIKNFAKRGKTVIFTTHYLQEADTMAGRIILFNQGEIVADGSPEEVKHKLTKQTVSFIAEENHQDSMLRNLPGATDLYREEGRIYIVTENTDEVVSALYAQGVKLQGLKIDGGSLDQAFEELTLGNEKVV